jgi:type I restriction-modification system DNA methylase subunit
MKHISKFPAVLRLIHCRSHPARRQRQTHMTILSLDQLEAHLWRAADILRGAIDASDYKHYIFGLLFFKRLCDVWEEEYEERLARYGDAELAATNASGSPLASAIWVSPRIS